MTRARGPGLPEPRGEISSAVLSHLRGSTGRLPEKHQVARADPYGDDLQLALYVLYELHYRGFEGVDDEHEWDVDLLRVRRDCEASFLGRLREDVAPSTDVYGLLDTLLTESPGDDGVDVSEHLKRTAVPWQLREYAVLRSLYQLKEADPHAWVIPRLRGRAKAAMVAVEFDEFGAGRPEDVHARLFADLMADLGLDSSYGEHLDAASAEALATVNVMSLFGLHRAWRGALVGHFAVLETTSSPGARRLAQAMRRAGAGPAAQHFYDEHVEADAVHEQVLRRDVIGGLLEDEPHLAPDVAFGIQATTHLEDRLAEVLLSAWREERTALRAPERRRGA